MEKEFVTYEQALLLKGLGFDEECCGGYKKSFPYDNEWKFYIDDIYCQIQAPLKQQVFRWFREKYNIIGIIEGGYTEGKNVFSYVIWQESNDDWTNDIYDTYEEAENVCIDKLIGIAKQQEK